jgi:HEAT repeat protein
MLYTTDESLRWQIIDMLGEIGNKVAVKRPDIVSKLLSNLLQSAAAPGASAWGSLEAAGAIISANPDFFGEFSPSLLSFLQHQNLRKETTWAIGKIASVRPDLVKYAFRALWSFLGDADPTLRGYAAWALGDIGYADVIEDLKKLDTDDEKLLIFRDGRLEEATVALLSRESLKKINKPK